jgi:hypothetical protein
VVKGTVTSGRTRRADDGRLAHRAGRQDHLHRHAHAGGHRASSARAVKTSAEASAATPRRGCAEHPERGRGGACHSRPSVGSSAVDIALSKSPEGADVRLRGLFAPAGGRPTVARNADASP